MIIQARLQVIWRVVFFLLISTHTGFTSEKLVISRVEGNNIIVKISMIVVERAYEEIGTKHGDPSIMRY